MKARAVPAKRAKPARSTRGARPTAAARARARRSGPEAATFFATPAKWRAWLENHHASETELWVGFRRKSTGLPSITWPESVDAALCFGWIDGLRKGLDGTSYAIRFTPRRPTSIWSNVNTKRFAELERDGLVRATGRKAFEGRVANRAGVYSFEQRPADLPPPLRRQFRAHPEAHAFFEAQPPSYRRAATWWVISAKQEATRQRRLETLIADSAARRRIKHLTRPGELPGRTR